MFSLIEIAIDNCIKNLQAGYYSTYGNLKPDYPEIIAWATTMVLEKIYCSDAAYHDVEHTVLVTLTGQEILRGKHIHEGTVTTEDWLHCILSLLFHDIGYLKGICSQDNLEKSVYLAHQNGETVTLAPGSTDASLTPYHVDRGKQFVQEKFCDRPLIDINILQQNIELTRFPVPQGKEYENTINYPGLVRGADLIGQLSDPRYLQKLPALYQEFEENGTNKNLGYSHPNELRAGFPGFFWNVVYPYLEPSLYYLNITQAGRQIITNLYANVFIVEQELKKSSFHQDRDLYRTISQSVRLTHPSKKKNQCDSTDNGDDRTLAFHVN